MTTGSDLGTIIYGVVLPVFVSVIMAILGLVRGARREAIVSGSVVLAALIIQTWASLWGQDLSSTLTSFDAYTVTWVLALIIMVLVVLVVGYGLGTLVGRYPLSAGDRLLGALLGLANGAAISGWLLRSVYLAALVNQPDTATGLSENQVAYGFIIWAAWFPIVLAVVGAIAALILPLTRARQIVAQPSPTTDWTPASPVATTTLTNTSSTLSTPYLPPSNSAYGAPYVPPNPQVSVPPAATAVTTAVPVQTPRQSPITGPLPPLGVRPAGTSTGSSVPARAFDAQQTQSNPPTQPTQSMNSSWLNSDPSVPAWLRDTSSSSSSRPLGQSSITSSAPSDTVRITPTSSGSIRSGASGDDAGVRCPNCGAPIQEGAQFCTDCGTRVK